MLRKNNRLDFIRPMEPNLFEEPPTATECIHEVKQDGYRTQAMKDRDSIRLFTKRGHDWTGVFSELAGEAIATEAQSFILKARTSRSTPLGWPTSMRCKARLAPEAPGISVLLPSICSISTVKTYGIMQWKRTGKSSRALSPQATGSAEAWLQGFDGRIIGAASVDSVSDQLEVELDELAVGKPAGT